MDNTVLVHLSGNDGWHESMWSVWSIMFFFFFFIRSFTDGQWYSFNDQQVTKVSLVSFKCLLCVCVCVCVCVCARACACAHIFIYV